MVDWLDDKPNFVKTDIVDTIHELYLHGYYQSKSFIIENGLLGLMDDEKLKKYRKLRRRMLIPKIIGKLKMQVSKQMNIINNTEGKTNWQADYYDIILRNRDEYFSTKKYIKSNPKNWENEK